MKTIILNIRYSLIALVLLTSNQIFAETVLRVASWLPPTNPMNQVVIPTWGKWIEEATEGRVSLKIEYGMGHPKTMFNLVEDGVVDASYGYHGYVPGRFKLPQIVEQPGLEGNAEMASYALWNVYNKYFLGANEFDGLELMALFTHGPGQIHSSFKVDSIESLIGKKIRIGGGVQSVLAERLEVTPVGAPAPKVYEMMQQGVVDGAFLPAVEQKVLRLSEVSKHLTVFPNGMYLGSFSMIMNPEFLADLSEKDQAAIRSVSGQRLSLLAGKAWDESDSAGIASAQEKGVIINFIQEDDEINLAFKGLVQGVSQVWLDSVASKEVDALAALQELRGMAQSYSTK